MNQKIVDASLVEKAASLYALYSQAILDGGLEDFSSVELFDDGSGNIINSRNVIILEFDTIEDGLKSLSQYIIEKEESKIRNVLGNEVFFGEEPIEEEEGYHDTRAS